MSTIVESRAADGDTALSPVARRDFAVIVPAYNEAENAPDLVRELRAAFERHRLDGEVIVVDDGSHDGTAEAMLREAVGWDRLRVVRHRRNFGKFHPPGLRGRDVRACPP